MPRPLDAVPDRRLAAARRLEDLLALVRAGATCDSDFRTARSLLDALPLASADFALAAARLENARRYVAAGEPGAAAFELRLLLGSLRTLS
jgi:hypothetical protein